MKNLEKYLFGRTTSQVIFCKLKGVVKYAKKCWLFLKCKQNKAVLILEIINQTIIYLCTVNDRNTKKMCEMCPE